MSKLVKPVSTKIKNAEGEVQTYKIANVTITGRGLSDSQKVFLEKLDEHRGIKRPALKQGTILTSALIDVRRALRVLPRKPKT